jgi:hypothetical protein
MINLLYSDTGKPHRLLIYFTSYRFDQVLYDIFRKFLQWFLIKHVPIMNRFTIVDNFLVPLSGKVINLHLLSSIVSSNHVAV